MTASRGLWSKWGVSVERRYCVYIMSNVSRMLYVGVTNDLEKRVLQHKSKLIPGYTQKYNLCKLVYLSPSVIFGMPSTGKNRSRAGFAPRKLRSLSL